MANRMIELAFPNDEVNNAITEIKNKIPSAYVEVKEYQDTTNVTISKLNTQEVELINEAYNRMVAERRKHTQCASLPIYESKLQSYKNTTNSNPSIMESYAPWVLSVYNSQAFRSWQLQLLMFVLLSAAALVMTSLALNPATLAAATPVIAHVVIGLSPLAFNAILGSAIGVAGVCGGLLGLSLYGRFFGNKAPASIESIDQTSIPNNTN